MGDKRSTQSPLLEYSAWEGMTGMMNRRIFLKLTGLAAASASALGVVPAAAQTGNESPLPYRVPDTALREPGLYQISGQVRLDAPLVEIDGIANAQQISWSGASMAAPRVAGFSSFETFDRQWRMPDVQIRGGTLEKLWVVPIVFG